MFSFSNFFVSYLCFSISFVSAALHLPLHFSISLFFAATLRHVCPVRVRAEVFFCFLEVGQHLILCKYSLSSLSDSPRLTQLSWGKLNFNGRSLRSSAKVILFPLLHLLCVCVCVCGRVWFQMRIRLVAPSGAINQQQQQQQQQLLGIPNVADTVATLQIKIKIKINACQNILILTLHLRKYFRLL